MLPALAQNARWIMPLLRVTSLLFGSLLAQPADTPTQTLSEGRRCELTVPNDVGPSGVKRAGYFGNEVLTVHLGEGGRTITFKPDGPGQVLGDGSLSIKFQWHRSAPGSLSVEGRRVDAPAPPLRSTVASGHGNVGVQPTTLIFPAPGCWEITGRLGARSLTFVTEVVKIGAGPTGRRTMPPTR